jgi:hypothetical protein
MRTTLAALKDALIMFFLFIVLEWAKKLRTKKKSPANVISPICIDLNSTEKSSYESSSEGNLRI